MAFLLPGLRRTALSISSKPQYNPFHLLPQSSTPLLLSKPTCSPLQIPHRSPILPFLRAKHHDHSQHTQHLPPHHNAAFQPPPSPSGLSSVAEKIQSKQTPFSPHAPTPEPVGPGVTDGHTVNIAFGLFMVASALSVFGIIVFGGLTRLTESGLSITQWKPVTGTLPPMSPKDWDRAFSLYKSSPEFALLNPDMTLPEFKKIYWMEWTHRLWGRFIGLSSVAGLAYFTLRRGPPLITRRTALLSSCIALGIGAQGFVGWWMVSSGLTDDLFAPGSTPRVSHYRLTAHLLMAFLLYTTMYTTGIRVLRNHAWLKDPLKASERLRALQNPALRTFRRLTVMVAFLIFTTAMSGALVAGLDAGLIYNEFPMMGNGLTPPKSELFSEFYCRREDKSDLWWRNMLENPATVQLDHRILATTTFAAVMSLFIYSRSGKVAAAMPMEVKKSMTGLVHLTLLQVTLGISTLIYMVPISLAALHQAGALLLLTGALRLAQKASIPKTLIPHIQKKAVSAIQASVVGAKKAPSGATVSASSKSPFS